MNEIAPSARPHILAHHLARFMGSSAQEQQDLVAREKRGGPRPFRRYAAAEDALAAYFARGQNETELDGEISYLTAEARSLQHGNGRMAACLRSSVEALQAFRGSDMEHYLARHMQSGQLMAVRGAAHITLGGVKVDVAPQVAWQECKGPDNARAGAVRFYFNQDRALSCAEAEAMTCLLRTWVARRMKGLGRVDNARVLVVDVFAGRVYRATGRGPREQVVSACEALARLW